MEKKWVGNLRMEHMPLYRLGFNNALELFCACFSCTQMRRKADGMPMLRVGSLKQDGNYAPIEQLREQGFVGCYIDDGEVEK